MSIRVAPLRIHFNETDYSQGIREPRAELPERLEEKIMTIFGKTEETFAVGFIDEGSKILLEVMNKTDQTLKCVEILTVFLKDEETPGSPSRTHISFEGLTSIQANEKSIMSHKTWIDGKPAALSQDQLARLKVMAGEERPYVLDFSWQDAQGKTRYQRIPVGH
jgi:hypothetical protein